jgi:hypothetical protein
VSLGTLFLGFVPVSLLFLATTWALNSRKLPRPAIGASAAEAAVLTLLAALWFGSLGHGGWPLVFLLLGLLVAGAERGMRAALLRSGWGRAEWLGLAAGVARYLAAGALLAWRLG